MAYIYQITNDINGKIYIGKTEFSIEKRFKEHCQDAFRERNEHRPLYAAMRKYGIEHFSISLIEKTDNPEEREMYWINYYSSYSKGYNATIGGDGKQLFNHQQIKERLIEHPYRIDVAQEFNCSTDLVSKIAKNNNILLKNRGQENFSGKGKKISQYTKKGEFIDSPNGRIVNPGHSLEAAWFIMAEGLVTCNDDAVNIAKHIIDITLPLGWDKKNGGIIAFTDLEGKPPVQLEWDMKLWWPQCEAMIAARLAYLHFKEEKYNEVYLQLKEYCEKYFCDDECGEWYGYLHYDNTVSTTLKGNIFKGPFHIPRLYMIMASMDETNGITEYMK